METQLFPEADFCARKWEKEHRCRRCIERVPPCPMCRGRLKAELGLGKTGLSSSFHSQVQFHAKNLLELFRQTMPFICPLCISRSVSQLRPGRSPPCGPCPQMKRSSQLPKLPGKESQAGLSPPPPPTPQKKHLDPSRIPEVLGQESPAKPAIPVPEKTTQGAGAGAQGPEEWGRQHFL